MIRHRLMLSLAILPGFLAAEEAQDDVLRFTNGDQIHGAFEGISEGPKVVWKRADVTAPMEISPAQVRQVVLHGGRPAKALDSLTHIVLVNGDRIPGALRSMDEKSVTIATSFAGEIQVPRDQVGMVAPNPLGGRLVYHGPFSADDWQMITSAAPEGLKPLPENATADDQAPGRWVFAGSAWYWKNQKTGTALVRKDGMPDRALFRFKVAWKNRISLAFAFHADFHRPAPKDPAEQPNSPRYEAAELFGNSYLVQLNGSNAMLCRTGYDDGKPTLEAIRNTGFSTRFGESDEATIEVRCNRQTGEIALFVNDEFVTQWSEGTGEMYSGKGAGFGFLSQGQGAVRISEIAMAEWNGMPDSARSLQVDEQDVVLLANGTDRLSGRVVSFKDGGVNLEGKYGNFRFPIDELAEIRFARNGLIKQDQISATDLVIRFYPLGRLSGKAIAGSRDGLRMHSPAAGDLKVSLESAVTLDFDATGNSIDDWDVPF
jgi:hypothetical protein